MFEFLNRTTGSKETAQAAPSAKASATGPVVAMQSSGRVAWSPRDIVSLTRNGFNANPIGFRAVKIISEAAAALPLVVQDRLRRYDVHPVQELLGRPNMSQGRAELFEALFAQILLTGNGYLEAVADDGLPAEMHVLRSDRMSLIPGKTGWPGYRALLVIVSVSLFYMAASGAYLYLSRPRRRQSARTRRGAGTVPTSGA